MSNYEFNHLGRISVEWRSNVRLTPLFKSAQVLTCSKLIEEAEEEFYTFLCMR